jgi:hypothetical protein
VTTTIDSLTLTASAGESLTITPTPALMPRRQPRLDRRAELTPQVLFGFDPDVAAEVLAACTKAGLNADTLAYMRFKLDRVTG